MTSRLAPFLTPRGIALVGCPGDPSRPGARPLLYLLQHRYPGAIYPVNPRHVEVAGVRAYPSLASLPERPDMVWIGVPADEVGAVLEEMGQLKIPNAVVLTAGFAETDAAGRRRQEALRALAEAAGITVLGPNMLGFINCWDRVPLTFSPAGGLDPLIPGALGIASQSGALGGIVVNRAFDRMIGVSAMVSTGNEMGITVSECLEYFAEDPRTRAVALIAEGIRDGDRFRSAAARLLEAGKPIVALKVGRSEAGRRNALTHTGALAGSHEAWRAVARQLGIVHVETLEELVHIAGYLSRERRSVRGRIGVLATSGGASIMTADHLEARGLTLPRLARTTVDGIGALLPGYARTRDNPVDVTAGLSEALFAQVLGALAADPGLDAVLTIVTGARPVERAENVARLAAAVHKPVLVCWLSGSVTESGVPVLDRAGVPCFRDPRTAAAALAASRDFTLARTRWRRRPESLRASGDGVVVPGRGNVRRRRAAGHGAMERGQGGSPKPLVVMAVAGSPPDPAPSGPLSYAEAASLARAAGVPLPPQILVATPAAAALAARRVGFPVAVKLVARRLAHKTEASALALGLGTVGDVRRAAERLRRAGRGSGVEGFLVQRMVAGGEALVGVTRDATWGPLLLVGVGGVEAELRRETTCRPLPVTRDEIRAMLGEVRGLGWLRGFRGSPPADVPALVGVIEGAARLARALGDRLASLDLNPVIVGPQGRGAWAVDLLLNIHHVPARPAGGVG